MAKILFLQPDGMADQPLVELKGRTPVEAARTPNLDRLASVGKLGLVHTIPAGFKPGSDIGNLVLLGHDPHKVFTGRAPLEAAAQGIETDSQDVVYRVNLVTIENDIMVDFTSGHISNTEGAELIRALNEGLADAGVRFHPGVSYRNLAVWADGPTPLDATPPHDLTGQDCRAGCAADPKARHLMERAHEILAKHPVNRARVDNGKLPATDIWLWGEGRTPTLQKLKDTLGITGAMITAVDLLRGIALMSGLEVHDVEGATGFVDTNYEGKAEAARQALRTLDMAFVHIEAPDESAHMGRVDLKIQAIEDFDSRIVGPLLTELAHYDDGVVICLPDHPTLIATKTHDNAPVPCVVARTQELRATATTTRVFSERMEHPDFELTDGWTLLSTVLKGGPA